MSVLALILGASLLSAGPSTSHSACENVAEFEMENCLKTEARRVDAELNRTYISLLKALPLSQQILLKESERAWIRCRDTDLIIFSSFPHGNHPSDAEYLEQIQIIKARIEFLQSLR